LTVVPPYAFADDPRRPGAIHHGELVQHLAAILDPFTTRRLHPFARPGARCLEVGAGAGSVALWLADRVGPDGQVTATDLDVSGIPDHPRIVRTVHNIETDPLDGRFDLIHARLVLGHVGSRWHTVSKLADALVPGGALVIEEFTASWDRCVMDSPSPEAQRLFADYHYALLNTLETYGTDTSWGVEVHRAMRDAGLVEVESELWARSWHGGEPGCLLPYAASAQLRRKLIAAGMSEDDLDAFRTLLLDPRLVIYANLAISTIGLAPS
jgi:SAM-dependent methyltransferase